MPTWVTRFCRDMGPSAQRRFETLGTIWRCSDKPRDAWVLGATNERARRIAFAVRSRRKHLGVTQQALARMAGSGLVFVYNIEHGKTFLRFEKLLDVLGVLGLDLVVAATVLVRGAQKAADRWSWAMGPTKPFPKRHELCGEPAPKAGANRSGDIAGGASNGSRPAERREAAG
jgi:HTH-type transcriptional regulator / antitoxin HipB